MCTQTHGSGFQIFFQWFTENKVANDLSDLSDGILKKEQHHTPPANTSVLNFPEHLREDVDTEQHFVTCRFSGMALCKIAYQILV